MLCYSKNPVLCYCKNPVLCYCKNPVLCYCKNLVLCYCKNPVLCYCKNLVFLYKEIVENTKYNNLSFYLNLRKYLLIVSRTFCVPHYTLSLLGGNDKQVSCHWLHVSVFRRLDFGNCGCKLKVIFTEIGPPYQFLVNPAITSRCLSHWPKIYTQNTYIAIACCASGRYTVEEGTAVPASTVQAGMPP